jgi:hypothetical protein
VHFVFMMFRINKIVQVGKCFGFKQWQLLSTGNTFFVAWRGGLISLWHYFGMENVRRMAGGQFYITIIGCNLWTNH